MSRLSLPDIEKTILELIDKANHVNDIVAFLLYELIKLNYIQALFKWLHEAVFKFR
jgi:hypothetical protein